MNHHNFEGRNGQYICRFEFNFLSIFIKFMCIFELIKCIKICKNVLLYLIIVCENHVMNFLSPIRNQCYGWLHSFDLLMLWCQTTTGGNSPILEVIRIDERQLSFDFVSFTDNNPLWPPFECICIVELFRVSIFFQVSHYFTINVVLFIIIWTIFMNILYNTL